MAIKITKQLDVNYITKLRSKFENIDVQIRAKQRDLVRETYLKELKELTSPFDTDLSSQFYLYNKQYKNQYRSNVRIKPESFERTSKYGGQVTYQQLFNWLNDGTSVNYAFMPEDFSNETFPNTLHTQSVAYNRAMIFVNKKLAEKQNKPGLQARNWTEQLYQKYPPSYFKQQIEDTTKGILKDISNT